MWRETKSFGKDRFVPWYFSQGLCKGNLTIVLRNMLTHHQNDSPAETPTIHILNSDLRPEHFHACKVTQETIHAVTINFGSIALRLASSNIMPSESRTDVELEDTKCIQTATPDPDPVDEKSLKEPQVVQRSTSPSSGNGSVQGLASQEEGQADVGDRGDFTHNSEITRIPYPISKAAWIVIIVGSLERMAFYGGSTPFQNYIQRSGHEGDEPGRLGKGQVTATALNQLL